MSVHVGIELPNDVYRALVPQAERCDTQVPKLIALGVTNSVRGVTAAAGRHDRELRDAAIAVLNGQLWTDNRIAGALGLSPSSVGSVRERLGLPKRSTTGRRKREQAA
ncbi:hypothetical protein ABIQ69_11375 [Agromyces sp. G08B096]|uniref:Uncharacterized protein n=1 Tax=Agromyces sp. G08B096 TaxID=3156399 RepID=A0AAU7W304_9MICO